MDSEERYLREALAMLQESYANAAKPYIDRLVRLQAIKPMPPIVVTNEQAKAMGFEVPNVQIDGQAASGLSRSNVGFDNTTTERKIKVSHEDIETANKMISDLKDSLRLNANTVMSLTAKLYAMHDAITALMDNSEEFEFDDGIGRGAQQCYWDEVNAAINETTAIPEKLLRGWLTLS